MKQIINRLRKLFGGREPESTQPTMSVPQVAQSRRTSANRERDGAKIVAQESGGKTAVDPIFLRQQISNHLDTADLQQVSQTLGIDFEQFTGGKGRKVLQLVTQCEKDEALETLLEQCQQLKPDVAWQLEG